VSDLPHWLTPQGMPAWAMQAFLVVLGALLLDFAQKLLLGRLHRTLKATHNVWDDALVDALRRPLSLLIWVVGITFAADVVGMAAEVSDAAIFGAVGPIRAVGVVVALTWFLIRVVRRVETNIVHRAETKGRALDPTTVDAISRLVRVSILITAALVGLQTLGFSVSGVLAFGGIGGIAVGFAAKDLLANFFGGLTIYLDRPFSVGDWIRSPDRDIEGTVEEIGWRLTRIRTFDKRPLYVPNNVFANIALENPSRMSHRRIKETIGIRYADWEKMGAITASIRQMLETHEAIAADQTLMVNFNAFGPSSVDFFIYCFTRTTVWTEYHQVKQDILLRVHAIIEGHGAEVAFPTHTVHVPDAVRVMGEPGASGPAVPMR